MNTKKKSLTDVRKTLLENKQNTTLKEAKTPILPSRDNTFGELLSEIPTYDFDCTSAVRIDTDIHEILVRLKKQTGVKIGPLLSLMAKQLLEEHKKEIKTLLGRNKFL